MLTGMTEIKFIFNENIKFKKKKGITKWGTGKLKSHFHFPYPGIWRLK